MPRTGGEKRKGTLIEEAIRQFGREGYNVQPASRFDSDSEIIGPTNFWIIGSVIALVGGLGMWALGQQFYIPLALAGLIFGYGGYIVWTRGQPVFTLMYLMFVIVGAGGLMVTANLAPIALDLKISNVPGTVKNGVSITPVVNPDS